MAKATKKPAPPPEDVVEVFGEVEQRSAEWFELRCGIPTASHFGTIMASSKDEEGSRTRRALLYRLAGEVLTGKPAEEKFKNRAMDRGIEMEPLARDFYARTRFAELEQVGFVRRTIHNPFGESLVIGCSPDSFVGAGRRKVLEIKTMMPELLIPLALKGAAGLPSEHRPQCMGSLWVTGADECDLMLFYEGMPVAPTFTFERNDSYIKTVSDAVEVFTYELRMLVARIRSMGPQG